MRMVLAEVDLGNGTNYNPQEALNMVFSKQVLLLVDHLHQDGDFNPC